MRNKSHSGSRLFSHISVVFILTALLVASLSALVQARPAQETAADPPFFQLNGSFSSGDAATYSYPVFGNSRTFNFSLTVTGTVPLMMTIEDASNQLIWTGTAEAGETLWGYGTLPIGQNKIHFVNGAGDNTFALNFYDFPSTPYTWAGVASPIGLNSDARLTFPSSGLYQFDFGVNSGGRYEFTLDGSYIQKTVESNTAVSYYIDAGVHDLQILQDAGGGDVVWSVAISSTGQTVDTLPYEKAGGDIANEWLPIFLDAPVQANLVLTATGAAGDSLLLEVVNGGTTIVSATVETRETAWTTFDLPAGSSKIHLTANGSPVDYVLSMDALPTVGYEWTGMANDSGDNSHIRVIFPTSGRYTFDLMNANGRYQFLLNDEYIQKTAETDIAATYYVRAGTHDLYIDQDAAQGADWGVGITGPFGTNDSLPYTQSGGDLSAAGDFSEEWLPIHTGTAVSVNLEVTGNGAIADSFAVELWDDSSKLATLSPVYGTETVWTTTNLPANGRLRIVASNDNSGDMDYDVTVTAVPDNGTAAWAGNALDVGEESVITVNFPTTGMYRFQVDADPGFANLVIDDAIPAVRQPLAGSTITTTYDIAVTAGMHRIYVQQDSIFANSNWSATVMPVSQAPAFFTFNGVLEAGEIVTPRYAVVGGGTMEFNFAFASSGGNTDLTITDGDSNTLWNGTALDGETVWGTDTLSGTNSFAIANHSGSSVNVVLTLYYLPTAGYAWTGMADGAGVNSHVRVNFPTNGLYVFDLSEGGAGRYQFKLNDSYLLKTAENNTAVSYYIPAGTHDLYLNQDSGTGADWGVNISNVGAGNDSLPYSKMGGDLGSTGNDFDMEWLPLHLAAATAVNMKTTLTGTTDDSATVLVYNASDNAIITTTVYANEANWTTLDLPAGTNRIKIMADGGNATPLSYEFGLYRLPSPTYNWMGLGDDRGENSHIRMVFPSDGLYDFALTNDGGRYQFKVDSDTIQKTVENDTAVMYYVSAGTHDLYIDQDEAAGAEWGVTITNTGMADDALPYYKFGGDIGGGGNDFVDEWLPLHSGINGMVNIIITMTGSTADSLQLSLWDDVTTTVAMAPLYGTETVWTATNLSADARIHLTANGGNAGAMAYEVAVQPIPIPTYTWSGASLAGGINSVTQMNMPVSGEYRVYVALPEGSANVVLDSVPVNMIQQRSTTGGINYFFDVPLVAGQHTFTIEQESGFVKTSWTLTTTLLSATPPIVASITPTETTPTVGISNATITGENFMPGVTVDLDNGTTYALNVTFVSATQLLVDIPSGLDLGMYDVVATNPDTQSARLTDGFLVKLEKLFLPLVLK